MSVLIMDSKEFANEVVAFRAAMGTRSFWNGKQEHRDGALKGLTFAYLGTVTTTTEEQKRVAEWCCSALDEYMHRAFLMGVET